MSVHASDARRLFSALFSLIAVVTVLFWVFAGPAPAQAALYGGAVALINGWMLRRRVARAMEAVRRQPGRELLIIVTGAMQRFIMTLALFLLGMGGFALDPIPMVVAFAIAQGAYVVAGALAALRPNRQVENV